MRALLLLPLLVSFVDFSVAAATDRVFIRERVIEKFYQGNIQALQAALSQPQLPERYLSGQERFYTSLKANDRVLGFSWSNCGSDSDPVQIKNLKISPDPIRIPGDITVSAHIINKANISHCQSQMKIQKKVTFWWVTVPCVGDVGSCDYSDMCTILPETCPESFQEYNVPCHCPFSQGDYVLPEGVITVTDLPLPSWLTKGDYKVSLNAKDEGGKPLFCVNLQLSIN